MAVGEIGLGFIVASLGIWLYLLGFRGQFWCSDECLPESVAEVEDLPSVCAVVPARNEVDVLPVSLRSLLTQNYPGSYTVILVDDHSTDGTAKIACEVARKLDKTEQLQVLQAHPLPTNWTGKLWALQQGIQYAQTLTPRPDYFLLTDADIDRDPQNLRQLVAKARQDDLDLVSLMVKLRCESFWEKFLIPAFIFFFEKLYPFRWVNDPNKRTAAAAGGCILISRKALKRIGEMAAIKNALIDDCALAQAVKLGRSPQPSLKRGACLGLFFQGDERESEDNRGRIWLGLSDSTRSLREYSSLATIWDMVARTAFTQLYYSLWLLLGTAIAMTLVYIVPPIAALFGGLTGHWLIAIAGCSTWFLMSYAYLPTIRYYECSPLWALSLPAIALFYTLMTLDSALRYWQKRGGAWKGRVYSES